MSLPDVSLHAFEMPGIYVQVAESKVGKKNLKHKMGVCQVVSGEYVDVNPTLHAETYAQKYMGKMIDFDLDSATEVNVIEKPSYGQFRQYYLDESTPVRFSYQYFPNDPQEFTGIDNFVVEVRKGEMSIFINYEMAVSFGQPYDGRCKAYSWKISSTNLTSQIGFTKSHSR